MKKCPKCKKGEMFNSWSTDEVGQEYLDSECLECGYFEREPMEDPWPFDDNMMVESDTLG